MTFPTNLSQYRAETETPMPKPGPEVVQQLTCIPWHEGLMEEWSGWANGMRATWVGPAGVRVRLEPIDTGYVRGVKLTDSWGQQLAMACQPYGEPEPEARTAVPQMIPHATWIRLEDTELMVRHDAGRSLEVVVEADGRVRLPGEGQWEVAPFDEDDD